MDLNSQSYQMITENIGEFTWVDLLPLLTVQIKNFRGLINNNH